MGVVNVSYTRSGEVALGLTYMTGTLVKLGQALGGAILGLVTGSNQGGQSVAMASLRGAVGHDHGGIARWRIRLPPFGPGQPLDCRSGDAPLGHPGLVPGTAGQGRSTLRTCNCQHRPAAESTRKHPDTATAPSLMNEAGHRRDKRGASPATNRYPA
ncbi:hypothetical protein [Glutamicibacter halophytocola]|uniref:hypothetical protein n=1 Tax=Glutamicibacter halophytocola TaxID=1933880 RepID=UPI003D2E5CCB